MKRLPKESYFFSQLISTEHNVLLKFLASTHPQPAIRHSQFSLSSVYIRQSLRTTKLCSSARGICRARHKNVRDPALSATWSMLPCLWLSLSPKFYVWQFCIFSSPIIIKFQCQRDASVKEKGPKTKRCSCQINAAYYVGSIFQIRNWWDVFVERTCQKRHSLGWVIPCPSSLLPLVWVHATKCVYF